MGGQPVLTAEPRPSLTLYGRPGTLCSVEYVTNLAGGVSWRSLTNLMLQDRFVVLPGVDVSGAAMFYRLLAP